MIPYVEPDSAMIWITLFYVDKVISDVSHQCLDHIHSLCPELFDAFQHVDLTLGRGLLNEDVDGYESPRPSNTSTEGIFHSSKSARMEE